MYMVGDDLTNDVIASQVVGMTGGVGAHREVSSGHAEPLGRRRIRDAAEPC